MRHTDTAPYKRRMHGQRGLPTSTAACCIRRCQRSVRQVGRTRGEEQRERDDTENKTKVKYRRPNARRKLPSATPLSQGDSGQLDQVSHARRDDDGLLVRVAGLVVTLHLLHHELGVAQERVLGEAVEVEAGGGHRRLNGAEGDT